MDVFREGKGNDGKYLFDIPLHLSSEDIATRNLDKITMKEWFETNSFTIKPLFNYMYRATFKNCYC